MLLGPWVAPGPAGHAAGVLSATLRPVETLAATQPMVSTAPRPHSDAARRASLPLPAQLGVPAPAIDPVPSIDSTRGAAERSAAVEIPPSAGGSVSLAAAPAATSVPAAGADPDGLRQYKLALAREARQFRRYPERARLAGIGGTAEVRVEHGAGIPAPVARLERSSGNEALDSAALDMMRLAAPRAAVPELLRGRTFAVSMPVVFDLDEN